MANSMGHPSNARSWPGVLAEVRALYSLSDDDVIALLTAWEAEHDRAAKPAMREIWYSRHRDWIERQLGIGSRKLAVEPEPKFSWGPDYDADGLPIYAGAPLLAVVSS